MATGMQMDDRSVDCLVLGHHDQDRKVSAKSVTIRAMTLCKNLSGYRELLLYTPQNNQRTKILECKYNYLKHLNSVKLGPNISMLYAHKLRIIMNDSPA